jgi:hypothetical protein
MTDNSAHEPSKTAEEILDLAEGLIQSRGYSAFSYQDIANARLASTNHFPSKAELGVTVVDRYAERFSASLKAIASDEKHSSMAMLDHYVKPYLAFSKTSDKVCLCGALAGFWRYLTNCGSVLKSSSRNIRCGLPKFSRGASPERNLSSRPSPRQSPVSFSEPCKMPSWSSEQRAMLRS